LMTAKTSEYDRDLNAGWLEVVGDITQFGWKLAAIIIECSNDAQLQQLPPPSQPSLHIAIRRFHAIILVKRIYMPHQTGHTQKYYFPPKLPYLSTAKCTVVAQMKHYVLARLYPTRLRKIVLCSGMHSLDVVHTDVGMLMHVSLRTDKAARRHIGRF
jgi:hypothetical protein